MRLSAAVQAHKELVEHIRAAFPNEDEASLADTIEGATELDAAILAVLREAIWREEQADALRGMVEKMRGRIARLEQGAEMMRAEALQAMLSAGMPKLWSADMSVNVAKGRPKVLIFDESRLPDKFWRVKRDPDKTAIGEALKAGEDIPGAGLSNVGDVLRIRRD